jgi:predicted transcriptional regulator of viral defense system
MHYLTLKNTFEDFPIFSIQDIKKHDPFFHRQRLNEWQKKGYIKKIKQNFYIFSDLEINEQVLFSIANHIYAPSYVSLEMALSFYNLIPESIYKITSISSKNTKTLGTPIGNFVYRHVKPSFMFGYTLKKYKNYYYRIAEMEKAILDYFYLNTHIKNKEDFEGLRFNSIQFNENMNVEKFNKYLQAFQNKSLEKRVNRFLKYIKHA